MANVIILIEDNVKDAERIMEILNNSSLLTTGDEQLYFDWVPGDVQAYDKNGFEHKYYTEELIEKIFEKKMQVQQEGDKVGILLDLLLTKEETEKAGELDLPIIELAKKVYFKFSNDTPIYIITSLNYFGAQCDIMMGVDLSRRYVSKSALIDYEMPKSIEKLINFYNDEFSEINEYVQMDNR